MISTIRKWGNSQGLRFSKELLEQLGLSVNDEVDVKVENKSIVITKKKTNDIDLEALFNAHKGEYKGEEYDWGEVVGDEVW